MKNTIKLLALSFLPIAIGFASDNSIASWDTLRSHVINKDSAALYALLEKNRENVNVQNQYGDTLLHEAISNRPFFNDTNDQVIDLLLQYNPNINTCNNKGETPLLLAINQAEASIVEKLIMKDADTQSLINETRTSYTLLLIAAFVRWKANEKISADACKIAQMLLDKNVSVNTPDTKTGLTPLMSAAYRHHNAMIELLMKNKANPLTKDHNSITAMMYAVVGHKKHKPADLVLKTIQTLLNNMSTPEEKTQLIAMKNKHGQTAIDIAEALEYDQVVSFLKSTVQQK